ncbi:unnamed protein product [Rangifer tarandus platyrhynchus]|uniref:Uncharacterized protein n=1 Tax=Rangifer tarandus platyrhynchus TaxID=3082113 RepID=A0AC59Z2P6_RANTA
MWKHCVLLHEHPVIESPFQSVTDLSYKTTFLQIPAAVLLVQPLKTSTCRLERKTKALSATYTGHRRQSRCKSREQACRAGSVGEVDCSQSMFRRCGKWLHSGPEPSKHHNCYRLSVDRVPTEPPLTSGAKGGQNDRKGASSPGFQIPCQLWVWAVEDESLDLLTLTLTDNETAIRTSCELSLPPPVLEEPGQDTPWLIGTLLPAISAHRIFAHKNATVGISKKD